MGFYKGPTLILRRRRKIRQGFADISAIDGSCTTTCDRAGFCGLYYDSDYLSLGVSQIWPHTWRGLSALDVTKHQWRDRNW